MQKKLFVLLGLLLISTILFAGIGAYLRMEYLEPFGLLSDKNLIEIPFVVMKDPAAQFAVEYMKKAQETEPAPETQAPETEPQATEPAETAELPDSIPETTPVVAPTEVPADQSYVEVTEDWFNDVLFIGDSRTVGLRDYARLGNADYFCSIGMTVFDATKQELSDLNFEQTNLEKLLQTKRYHKIYISLGLNESGAPYDLLMEGYGALMDMVRKNQPDATIILHAMITVSRKKAASEWYFSLENLDKINSGIRQFADGDKIRYIDANGYFADEEGYLPEGLMHDGCHFYKSGYQDWAKWILENAKTLDISFG